MSSINVTKPFLPPFESYMAYVSDIWQRSHLTNHGPLVQKLENQLTSYLSVPYLSLVSNGTLALQLALNAFQITEGEVITTPFSYVATVSSLLWQQCTPIFVDINPSTLSIDVGKIEEKITPRTRAILAVHVFGYPCPIEPLAALAKAYNLKIIYDGAHAFGCFYKGKSLLSYGDAATCSFHATKLFHTAEGGAVIVHDENVAQKINLSRSFGSKNDDHICLGINGKLSELHAALGLANFPYLSHIIEERKKIYEGYDTFLKEKLWRPALPHNFEHNYSYYPVVFDDHEQLVRVLKALAQEEIYPRRYFYPSLNHLSYLKEKVACPVSESIASRIVCLPLYAGLSLDDVERISTHLLAYL